MIIMIFNMIKKYTTYIKYFDDKNPLSLLGHILDLRSNCSIGCLW